ncbi:GET complex subunit get1 [Elasticomyces elasticus]|nr:GET complex subunit get1 [Elasticomyces elasticus]
MVSVLLTVFLLQLAIHLVNTFGAQAVNELVPYHAPGRESAANTTQLWNLYTKLPTPQSKDADESSRLRKEVARLHREMKSISAQDDFAKWARVIPAASLTSFRTTFDRLITAARWLGTQGLQFFCNFYYSKQAMFWLPQGWVPYHVEWVLSFPKAQMGAVSINIWSMACASVIALASEGIRASLTLKDGRVREGSNKGEKIKMEALGAGGGKKEL